MESGNWTIAPEAATADYSGQELTACVAKRASVAEDFDALTCRLTADGTMQIFDGAVTEVAEPFQLPRVQGTFKAWNMQVPVRVQSAHLRETEVDAPYRHRVVLKTFRFLPAGAEPQIHTRVLELRLHLAAKTSGPLTTFVERMPATTAPTVVYDSRTQGCVCNSTCATQNDGWCDDGGIGSSFSTCAHATDCMDCGPRSADRDATTAEQLEACIPGERERDLYRQFACPAVAAVAAMAAVAETVNGPTDCNHTGLASSGLRGESACLIRDASDWVDGDTPQRGEFRCRVKHGEDRTAIQISDTGCGFDGLLGCFICCAIPSPPPPMPIAPPAAPPSMPNVSLAADNLFRRRLYHELSQVENLGLAVLGTYDPQSPSTAGRIFEVVLRDVDGIPIVRPAFRGVERIKQFRFLIERERPEPYEKPSELPLYLTSAASHAFTSARPAHRMRGRVEVTISLQRVGLHYIKLYGPTEDGAFQQLPLQATVAGACPEGQTEFEKEGTLRGTCNCGAGQDQFERLVTDVNDVVLCETCQPGYVKDKTDEKCTLCAEKHERTFGEGNAFRRETRDDNSADRTIANHNDLSDCGCSVDYFMDFVNSNALRLRDVCPSRMQIMRWLSDEFAVPKHLMRVARVLDKKLPEDDSVTLGITLETVGEVTTIAEVASGSAAADAGVLRRMRLLSVNGIEVADDTQATNLINEADKTVALDLSVGYRQSLLEYQARCAASACTKDRNVSATQPDTAAQTGPGSSPIDGPTCRWDSRLAWACIERACREDYITQIAAVVESNPFEKGSCLPCAYETSQCPRPFTTVHSVTVREGFWRSNELSEDFRDCGPGHCVGSNQTTLASATVGTEDLCRHGHFGPLCYSCLDNFYKDISGHCRTCDTEDIQRFIEWAPMATLGGGLLLFFLLLLLRLCGLFSVLFRNLAAVFRRYVAAACRRPPHLYACYSFVCLLLRTALAHDTFACYSCTRAGSWTVATHRCLNSR